MGVTRIQAIGPGAVEYLLRGCDPAHPEPGEELEPGQEPEGGGPAKEKEAGIGYFLDGHGEPAGRWLGSGMEGLGLSMRAGDLAREEDLRAMFGELRFPNSERADSTREHPVYLGRKPRNYQTVAERVEAALKAEPDASQERRHEIEVTTARNTKSNTAYYDVTFSPVKSVSVYYAALLANGDFEAAQRVRAAHDQAVRIAIDSIEPDVAWAKTGRHGRASASGRTTGRWEKATGLAAVQFAHHTNRDGEPQLHAHVGVLDRVALPDGRVHALDGAAFRPVKDAMTANYDRALEAILSDLAHLVWVERADGLGREIDGIDPDLLDEASTRTREHVEPRIAELAGLYKERHGYEPGPQARRKIIDQAVKDTRRPKTGPGGPAAVAAWIDQEEGRRERLLDALDGVNAAVEAAGRQGWPGSVATEYTPGREREATPGPEMASGHEPAAGGQEPGAGGREAVAGGHEVTSDGHPPGTGGQSTEVGGHEPSAVGHQRKAGMGGEAAAVARDALGQRAVAAGLASVQAKYPSWSIGALVLEIDRALGSDVNAVGLGIDDRRAWLRGLAEAAVTPGSGSGVVQVSMGDPVPVPAELRREIDGRSALRAPIDERYATATHLGVEERLIALAQAPAVQALHPNIVGRVAEAAARDGLSVDQVDAITQILSSTRRVEVFVGPAGAGKSHTLGRLAQVWTEQHGGRVIGTSTAEVATRNLAETGMDAVNIRGLVTALTPNEQGRTWITLAHQDLLVIDEAGMVSTKDLDELMGFAVAAGCKVIWAGDHRQLPAIEAGGVFAHLADKPGAIELDQVHRFRAEWEREASLQLRAGDAAAAVPYADHGRLRAGTREQMEYLATRDYLADRLEGASSLLIVGSNDRASQLSSDIQTQLAKLGIVGQHDLVKLRDRTRLRMGDLIQAREGNRTIRVDGGMDEHGRAREAFPVANREVFTVVGFDPQTGTVFARDERGAVAHLPKSYVETQVTLAYAVTNHAAQGVSVDRGRPLAERGTSLEALYPQATRGKFLNVVYLETAIDPDPHHPQRERDTAIAAMGRMAENDAGELTAAATTVRDNAALEARSMLTLAEHYDRIAAGQCHSRHAAIAIEKLGPAVEAESAFGVLLGRMRAVELEGHNVTAMFDEAVAMSRLGDARELSKVLHWRLGVLQATRTPETPREQLDGARRSVRPAWEQLAEQHRARAAQTGDALEGYLADVAARAHERTRELGVEVAADPPVWAREWLGQVPDPQTQPVEHATCVRDAGQVAAYREWRGIPDNQTSIGQAPPPAQQLAHELWLRVAEAGAGDPRVIDWRKASDQQLRETIATWEREQAWAPAQVSPERGEALALAHDANSDAVLGRARLAVMAPDDPERERLELYVEAHEVMAEQAAGLAGGLDGAYDARQAWWEDTREQREAAHGAEAELARRGLPLRPEREPEPGGGPEDGPTGDPTLPQPDAGSGEPEVATSRAEQHAFDLDLDPSETAYGAEEIPPSGHDRFLERLVVEHQRALDEVDPDCRLDPTAREAALRARNYERFLGELRAEHGARLDPEGQLSDLDLAHARSRELAESLRSYAAAPEPAVSEPAVSEPAAPEPTEPGNIAPESDPAVPAPLGVQGPEVEADEVAAAEPAVPAEAAAGSLHLDEAGLEPHAPESVVERATTAQPEQDTSAEPQPASAAVVPEPETAPETGTGTDVEPEAEPDHEPLAELRRVAREDCLTRVAREAERARQAEADTGPEPSAAERRRERAAEFEREAALDDELAAHRAPQQDKQAELERQREREADHGPEID